MKAKILALGIALVSLAPAAQAHPPYGAAILFAETCIQAEGRGIGGTFTVDACVPTTPLPAGAIWAGSGSPTVYETSPGRACIDFPSSYSCGEIPSDAITYNPVTRSATLSFSFIDQGTQSAATIEVYPNKWKTVLDTDLGDIGYSSEDIHVVDYVVAGTPPDGHLATWVVAGALVQIDGGIRSSGIVRAGGTFIHSLSGTGSYYHLPVAAALVQAPIENVTSLPDCNICPS